MLQQWQKNLHYHRLGYYDARAVVAHKTVGVAQYIEGRNRTANLGWPSPSKAPAREGWVYDMEPVFTQEALNQQAVNRRLRKEGSGLLKKADGLY